MHAKSWRSDAQIGLKAERALRFGDSLWSPAGADLRTIWGRAGGALGLTWGPLGRANSSKTKEDRTPRRAQCVR